MYKKFGMGVTAMGVVGEMVEWVKCHTLETVWIL